MGRKVFGIGMSLVLSLMMAHLPIGAHACCCGDDMRIEASCATCPPACGTVGSAPCCPPGGTSLRVPAHAEQHHPTPVAVAAHASLVSLLHFYKPTPAADSSFGPPLFIVHRALLL